MQSQGRTVLVVDDDADIRQVLTDAFEAEGFRVQTAANGMQALHRVRDTTPDAIVLDISMPIMGGDDFLYAWRAGVETPGVPVIAMSAAFRSLRPSDLGIEAFFPKPFDIEALVRHVVEVVARPARPAVAVSGTGRGAEVSATLDDLAHALTAVLTGVEALAEDAAVPAHLRVVATTTLGSAQRASILMRRLRQLTTGSA